MPTAEMAFFLPSSSGLLLLRVHDTLCRRSSRAPLPSRVLVDTIHFHAGPFFIPGFAKVPPLFSTQKNVRHIYSGFTASTHFSQKEWISGPKTASVSRVCSLFAPRSRRSLDLSGFSQSHSFFLQFFSFTFVVPSQNSAAKRNRNR